MPRSSRFRFQGLLQVLFLTTLLFACGKEKDGGASISLLSITANSGILPDGATNIPTDLNLELTFSAALDIPVFQTAFSLTSSSGAVNPGFSYANASSKAIITVNGLAFNTDYQLKIQKVAIGRNGELLDREISIHFTTADGGVITEMAPCISASSPCLQTAVLTNAAGTTFNFDFFSSYPIYLDNARWEKLENAVIVTHGQNRDADNYFSYLMTTLRNEGLDGNTILIAPFFKSNADATAGDLYWSDSGWREGQNADNPNGDVSAFEVIDRIIARLADKDHFPVLKNLVLTGHSSGALFTQVYAAANKAEALYPDIDFQYVVANSQYFYYPDDVRYQESTGQFVLPAGCTSFNHWPLGFVNPPAYLNGAMESAVDQQIVERQITYLLGDADTITSGTLNTTDCAAVLLGPNRFKRGEYFYSLLEARYNGIHRSRKVLVPGIGHDAQGMYQSGAFRTLIRDLFQ